MSLQFIDNAAIDRSTRRLIRSHVAMGRNVGKTRPPRSKQSKRGAITPTPIYTRHSGIVEHNAAVGSGKQETIEIERQLGDGLSVLGIPADLDAKSRGLFKSALSFINGPICIPELRNVINFEPAEAKRLWIQAMFLDEAYFHCVIAMFVAVVNPVLSRQGGSSEAMYHLSQTFRLVNQKLSSSEALSDMTMVVVIAMTQYERSQSQYGRGLIHFNGLERIVELRGGITELLNCKPGLAQKVLRADLEFALHLGSATSFRIENLPNYSTTTWLLDKLVLNQNYQLSGAVSFRKLTAGLQDLLTDIAKLTWLLNGGAGQRIQLDGNTFHDIIISLGYRLLDISSLAGTRPLSSHENILHFGLIAFLTTFLLGFSCTRPDYPMLAGHTRSALQSQVEVDKDSQELILWVLFISRATIFNYCDDTWLIPMMKETISSLGLCMWEEVCQTLSKFPWVNSIHDFPSKAIWSKLTSRGEIT